MQTIKRWPARPSFPSWPLVVAAGWMVSHMAWAQPLPGGLADTAPTPLSLHSVFEQAWAQQPEARSAEQRRAAAGATRQAASAWTPEPPALNLQTQTDRPGSNHGSREYEAGVSVPLWLPGERARKGQLAHAEQAALESGLAAARLRLAGEVREAWWAWQRARAELGLAQDRLASAQGLARDVARRFKAGDLSQADRHQADSAVAQAESAVAEVQGAHDGALAALRAHWGARPADAAPGEGGGSDEARPEPLSGPLSVAAVPEAHPALAELQDQAQAARRAAELAATQTRANPELTLAATRSKGQAGERYQQTVTLGVRIPLGAGPRAQAREATALAETADAEARAAIAQSRLAAEAAAARARLAALQAQVAAMARNAGLARETLAFYEKSFRLGETDLPTRLRVALEAAQAQRQLARLRIDEAAAISALRQALGLLPE